MGLILLYGSGGGSGGTPATGGAATNLYFLFNEAGRYATSITVSSAGTADGYDTTDIMSGPRSTMWRSNSFTSVEIGYNYGFNVGISYVVVARADLLLTSATKQVVGRQKNAGGTWSDIPGFIYNPLTSASLVGPRSQDLVVATVPTDLRGIGIYTAPPSGSEATMFSKLYAGGAFAFGVPPQRNIEYVDLPPKSYVTTLQGTMPYEVERTFSLTFDGVTQSEYTQFLLYDAFTTPFFLYDSTGDLWSWQLEHVILSGMTATMNAIDDYTLTMTFNRLRTYDYR